MSKKNAAAAQKKSPKAAAEPGKVLGPQLRILAALAKAGRPLSKEEIMSKAAIPSTWVAEYLGGTVNSVSDVVRGAKKLVPAGLARRVEIDVDGATEVRHEVTAAGRKLVAKQPK